jgi:proton-dependent oligopeptide transporter, POT family
MSSIKTNYTEQLRVMGHPAGLFVLFFTEMWERFSYYGMRAILVLFLVSSTGIGGWEWSNSKALTLYAFYTGLVYVTPIFGGIIADKFLGYRKSIMIGAFLMTLGHGALALETEIAFYAGLILLILGNGMFKPNISSVVGGLYKKDPQNKDGGYSIFYMGINAGAFLGMMLCGFLGEIVGWSYGFGLAGIFMLVGMIMFYFGQGIFDQIGLQPEKSKSENEDVIDTIINEEKSDILDTPASSALNENNLPSNVIKDRLFVIGVLAFFTIFFWMAFEQAGGSMTIFANSFTDRILSGDSATWFTIINTLITIVPLAIITYVLFLLAKSTVKTFSVMILSLSLSFLVIWGIVGWKVNKEYNTVAYEVSYLAQIEDENTGIITPTPSTTLIRTDDKLELGTSIHILDVNNKGDFRKLTEQVAAKTPQSTTGTVNAVMDKELEVPASWFGVLNSLFIILLAPVFSKIWGSKYNPTGPVKFGIGLILLGLGFAVLAFGSMTIPKGAETAQVSMIFLILAYLLHTMGELAVSPVGLSYVSKLSPANLVGFMFGIWFLASFVANTLAGLSGSFIDKISEEFGLTVFFLVFTAIPALAGVAIMLMNKFLLKKMHGIR